MSTYSERLTIAMERAGFTVAKLAKDLDLSYQAVKKVTDGLSSAFNAPNHDKAASLLGVSSSWLANELGPMINSNDQPVRFTPAALFLAESFDARPVATLQDQDEQQKLYWKLIAMMQYGDEALANQPVRQPVGSPIYGPPRKS